MPTLYEAVKARKSTETAMDYRKVAGQVTKEVMKWPYKDAMALLRKAQKHFGWSDDDIAAIKKGNSQSIIAFILHQGSAGNVKPGMLQKFLEDNKLYKSEVSAIEKAKKRPSHDKMAKKISAIVNAMGITAGEWEKLSDKVFRMAFGKKA